jgi:hypothetical protein
MTVAAAAAAAVDESSSSSHSSAALQQRWPLLPGDGIVSATLLAWTKDVRYVEWMRQQLSTLLFSYKPSITNSDYNHHHHDALDSALLAELISSILYYGLVLSSSFRNKNNQSLATAGMQVCGLRFHESIRRWKCVSGACMTAFVTFIVRRYVHRCRRRHYTTITHRHVDRESLTGSHRRFAFQEQRRQMLQRSLEIQNSQLQQTNSGTESAVRSSPTFFHRTINHDDQTVPTTTTDASNGSRRPTNRVQFWKFVKALLRTVFINPIVWSSEHHPYGPHAIPSASSNVPTWNTTHNIDTTTENHPHPRNNDDDNHPNSLLLNSGIGAWIWKCHLALFCWNEMYPNGLFRFFYRKPCVPISTANTTTSNASSSSSSSTGMTIPRIVACLIFSQAIGTTIQTVLRSFLYRWIDVTRSLSWDHNSIIASAAVGRNHHRRSDDGIVSTNTNPSSSSSTTTVCAICHRPRVHSACLATCGHVFCWKCLVSWVSSSSSSNSSSSSVSPRREYCPLCRKPGRIKDILLLQDYEISQPPPPR